MKKFRMPWQPWDDAFTREIVKKEPGKRDPWEYHRIMMHDCPGGPYMINNKNRERLRAGGPLKPPYLPGSVVEERYADHDAFVLAPGPSMADADLSAFDGKLSLAVNSAGFKFAPHYWAIFESNYLYWLLDQDATEVKIPPGRVYLMTARCALPWRSAGRTARGRAYVIPRWEEELVIPPRTPAVCITGALVGAWQMGCRRAYVVGLDLSRPGKVPYVPGVPHSAFGATNSFDDQVIALRQFQLPGFEVFNASPHSRKLGLPFAPVDVEEVERIARAAPPVRYPPEIEGL